MELGAFFNGGLGVDHSKFSFFWAGVHVGKVLTGPPAGPGFLKGNLSSRVS